MHATTSTRIHHGLGLLIITILMAMALLPQLGQAQYVDSQRQALHLTQTKNGSGTMAVIQGLIGGAVEMEQGSSATFVIPEAIYQHIDHNGTALGLHNEQGELLFETVSETQSTDLPTVELAVGTYLLTAISNLFQDTYVIHVH